VSDPIALHVFAAPAPVVESLRPRRDCTRRFAGAWLDEADAFDLVEFVEIVTGRKHEWADLIRMIAEAKNGFTTIYACSDGFADALATITGGNLAEVAQAWRTTTKSGDIARSPDGEIEEFLHDLLAVSAQNTGDGHPVWIATYVY